MKGFRFKPEEHSYWLDGSRLSSVTQVLSAQGLLADHSRTDPYYAERGKAIHEGIRLGLLGRLDRATVQGDLEPYIDRALFLVEELEIEPKVIEQPLFDRVYRVAGTPDLAGYSARLGATVVLDWKSGDDDPGYEVQLLGGYSPLIEYAAESGQIDLDKSDLYLARYGVVLLKHSPAKVKWYEADHRHLNRVLFRSALAVYNWRKQKGVA